MEIQRNPDESFQESSPLAKTYGNIMKCYLLISKLMRDSLRLLTGSLSHRYPLPSIYQNSRLLGRKQAFSMSPIVCAISVGTVSRYHLGKVSYLCKELFACQESSGLPVANLESKTFYREQSQVCGLPPHTSFMWWWCQKLCQEIEKNSRAGMGTEREGVWTCSV